MPIIIEPSELKIEPIPASDLYKLGLSNRTRNSLMRAKIRTLEDLEAKSEEELQDVRNIGPTALQEIRQRLIDYHSR